MVESWDVMFQDVFLGSLLFNTDYFQQAQGFPSQEKRKTVLIVMTITGSLFVWNKNDQDSAARYRKYHNSLEAGTISPHTDQCFKASQLNENKIAFFPGRLKRDERGSATWNCHPRV